MESEIGDDDSRYEIFRALLKLTTFIIPALLSHSISESVVAKQTYLERGIT